GSDVCFSWIRSFSGGFGAVFRGGKNFLEKFCRRALPYFEWRTAGAPHDIALCVEMRNSGRFFRHF
ncbi:MAG TPA: hypothetical protein H9883_06350, partial [Candidatus Ruthenibacterium merdigallinarum]|nr:hypothetical protein [Candidatus Ruthenibacterium merdigallinarum]